MQTEVVANEWDVYPWKVDVISILILFGYQLVLIVWQVVPGTRQCMKIVYGILNFKLIWDINAEENHKRQDVIYKVADEMLSFLIIL